ncbi:MAG: nucleotidyltransferase family protein [Oscillospiraceae bacterium]|nr:nucleotidyltransferase family protein [Oscillospiraceae bacterium]
MSNTQQIESTACSVFAQYPVKRAALFGSAARGDITTQSDIDVLVEFLPNTLVGLDFFGLHVDLQEALGRSVDLITWNALHKQAKPNFRNNVERDTRIIYER